MVLLIAHRGFRISVLENTFRAISLAVTHGMDYIELDTHLSADHEAFVLHDETLDRTMGIAARLGDLTAAQVGDINTTRGDEGIPRLSDVFDFIIKHRTGHECTRLMVELKGKGTGEVVAPLVQAYHVEDLVAFSGKDLRELGAAHDAAPRVPLCLNVTSCKEFTTKQLVAASSSAELPLPFAMVSLRAREVKQAFIHACHRLGAKALAWDFIRERRPMELLSRLVRDGLDGALIDDPGMVKQVRYLHPENEAVTET